MFSDGDKKGKNQSEADKKRSERPEMSEFDKFNAEEIRKQTKDTSEPFKVQPRHPSNDSKLLRDRPHKLNLKQFEIGRENEVGFDPAYERPRGIMDFVDRRLSLKPGN